MTTRDPAGRPSGGASDPTHPGRNDPKRFARALGALPVRDQVLAVLALPADRRAQALTHAPRPMRLVRSLPAPDLYLTIREIGPVDALPLVSLASAEQLQHVLDLESWRGDRFDGERAGAWAALLAEAGEATLRRVVRAADDAEIALLFQAWARIEQIEFDDQVPIHGHGHTETGDERGAVTPDGYHRMRPELQDHVPAAMRLATLLFTDDPPRYQRILWAAVAETRSQLEEDGLRWRGSRLEEHGYPPWDEAVAIYAAPSPSPSPPPRPVEVVPDAAPTAARYPLAAVDRDGGLAAALEELDAAETESFLAQVLSIASRVIVADGLDTGDPMSHVRAVRKALGTIEIGLATEAGAPAGGRPVERLRRAAVIETFRAGHARVADLRHRATALVRDGWAAAHPAALDLLDEPIRSRVEALTADPPRYHVADARDPSQAARDFERPEEVDETRVALEIAEVLGEVLVMRLGTDVGRLIGDARARGRDVPGFGTLFTTLMAWNALRGELRLEPLGDDDVAAFLRNVASRRTAPPDAAARALEGVVSRIAERAGLGPRQRGQVEAFGRACVERMIDECGALDPGTPVDGRYLSCLWLAAEAPGEERR